MKTKKFNLKNLALGVAVLASMSFCLLSTQKAKAEEVPSKHNCITLFLEDGSAISYCVGTSTYCTTVADCIVGGS